MRSRSALTSRRCDGARARSSSSSATNVRAGKVKVFERHEIGAEHVLASGCLPFMFQAIEIDGEHYWDGGYMGNPAIFPLIYGSESKDIVVVHINPLEREELPRTRRRYSTESTRSVSTRR
jgi:NTE family protein